MSEELGKTGGVELTEAKYRQDSRFLGEHPSQRKWRGVTSHNQHQGSRTGQRGWSRRHGGYYLPKLVQIQLLPTGVLPKF